MATAKTSGPDHYLIGRLTSLFVTVVSLISAGKRPKPMINALFRALQLFKENKLGLVKSNTQVVENAKPELQGASKDSGPNAEARARRHQAAWSWANKLIEATMLDPANQPDDPAFPFAARMMFDDQPAHQCYWNNRFCIAVMCDLEWRLQRLAAWCAVSNGLNDYWEWRTHSGYNMTAVLNHLQLLPADFVDPATGSYSELRGSVAAAIIKYFDLPTTVGGIKKTLTKAEEEERTYFNRQYCYVEGCRASIRLHPQGAREGATTWPELVMSIIFVDITRVMC